MKSNIPYIPATAIEAIVSSRGGIQTGSRIRFSLTASGGFQASQVLYELEDLWKMTDQAGKAKGVMSFDEMNELKTRRRCDGRIERCEGVKATAALPIT